MKAQHEQVVWLPRWKFQVVITLSLCCSYLIWKLGSEFLPFFFLWKLLNTPRRKPRLFLHSCEWDVLSPSPGRSRKRAVPDKGLVIVCVWRINTSECWNAGGKQTQSPWPPTLALAVTALQCFWCYQTLLRTPAQFLHVTAFLPEGDASIALTESSITRKTGWLC